MKKCLKESVQDKVDSLTDYLEVAESCSKNPVPVKEIAAFLLMEEKTPSCPQTRELIRQAIKQGHPIGSNTRGYFIIRNEKEMQKYLNSLMSRQVALAGRTLDVYNAYYNR